MSRLENPKHGNDLMKKIILLKAPIASEAPKRKTLFKTTCNVNGKVCKFVNDSGAIDRISSIEKVYKLKLKRICHPYPYRASWLTRDKKTLVNE